MLENTGSLFDESASLLGSGLEHSIELTLTNDDVHLATKAGVRQKLLNVEQSTGLAVDRILAAAVAKQRATDGDLGVVDRQSAIRVIDREQNLGTPKRALG